MNMVITWDEPKRQANLAKHGMDFADLTPEFFLSALILRTHSNRIAAIGPLNNGVVTTIYAELGTQGIAVISLRPASQKERKAYDQSI